MEKQIRIAKTKGKSCTFNLAGLKITYDMEVNAFYIYLTDSKKVHRTIEIGEGGFPLLLIDLDKKGKPQGIEIIWH